ncbi:hypothetical protein C0W80_06645 [Photobacterium leiognathi subsp. mandapamensis]|uniref:hypothetical protein n=1 Tax=Photobacterium leiognathi TaxID=553611 RepID=UPI000D154AD5|nr:hypothetical protein [Photobacterium leiognathi]PSV02662.1 hypothetical protein C0W80_06645 [Photobacterium leiognathi subsp. mandapamensis]
MTEKTGMIKRGMGIIAKRIKQKLFDPIDLLISNSIGLVAVYVANKVPFFHDVMVSFLQHNSR